MGGFLAPDIALHLPGILLAYSIIFVGIFSPGPAVLAIIGTSMENGRGAGSALAFGVVCGSAFWGVAAALGLSGILATYAEFLTFLKVAGGLYLLWLAWGAFKSARTPMNVNPRLQASSVNAQTEFSRMWTRGLLIHLMNPKAIVVWLATIALGVSAQSPLWVSIAIVLGGIVISTLGNLGYAYFFSSPPVAAAYLKMRRPIQYVFGGFFGAAGLKLIFSRD